MQIKAFYDEATYTLTYVVYDEATKDAVVIDPVLDYNPGASQISLESYEPRFRMRQKQINLAKKSGKKHIFQKEFN